MIIFRFSLILLAFLGSCSKPEAADSAICGAQLPAIPTTMSSDREELERRARLCVQRSAFSLAKGVSSSDEIARASMESCRPELLAAVQPIVDAPPSPRAVVSRRQLAKEWREVLDEQLLKDAQMWAVQSKAGKCFLMVMAK